MEMPNRRALPYNSEFTAVESTAVESFASPVHKAKSAKHLDSLKDEPKREQRPVLHRPKSQEVYNLHRVVSTPSEDTLDQYEIEKELEELREQLELLPFKKKYSSITVPTSVKYSTMAARPKSPKKNAELNEKQLDHEKLQAGLDQTLSRIREQLSQLSTERVSMEQQVEELTSGIKEARLQCHDHCRRNASAMRRRALSSTSPRMQRITTVKSNPATPKQTHSPKEPPKRPVSPLLIQKSMYDSFDPSNERHRSISVSDYTHYGSLGRRPKSKELKVQSEGFTSTPNVSLSQGHESFGGDWLPNPIPELPESPCYSKPSPPPHQLTTRIKSNPTLHYASNTTPRSHRSHSQSTPPLISITSSPDLSASRKSDPQRNPISHRNSLPESVMNKIVEDEIDLVSVSDSLSQASLSQMSSCFDEGSPKSQGSTVIMRRSSLTGQVEHIRHPRKRNSFNGVTIAMKQSESGSSNKVAYRVLNTGYKRNRKNKVILPNSIETTV